MKKQYRLKKKQQFQDVIKNGKKITSDLYIIYYKDYSEIENTEIGISVSKKIEKLAVKRNKIKRQIKSFFTDYKEWDKKIRIVIIVRNNYKKESNKSIKGVKDKLFNSLNKIK
jgi:ribonuclease P protein component